jgi:hypothetical protein
LVPHENFVMYKLQNILDITFGHIFLVHVPTNSMSRKRVVREVVELTECTPGISPLLP